MKQRWYKRMILFIRNPRGYFLVRQIQRLPKR